MVIVEASDELFVFTVEVNVSILPANEDEKVVEVLPTVVIEAASDELFVFTALVRLFIDVAADELLVVIVLFMFVTEEFSEADVV